MSEIDCDVAIIGAGPVGLALAHLLGLQGHSVVLIERHRAAFPLPRAIVFDYEAARLFRRIGLAEETAALGRPSLSYQWFNADWTVLWTFDFSATSPCGGPINYTFNQPELEAALEHSLASRPSVTLQRGWEAVGLTQDAEHAHVTCAIDDGSQQVVRARYVVGCDGANSFVRAASDLTLDDLGFRADWLVVDVRPNPGAHIEVPDAAQWCNPARPVTLVPGGHDDRRWEFMLLPGETWEQMQDPNRVWSLLSRWVRPDQATLLRHSVYRFRSAIAPAWRAQRALIAGDAAHLMPPFMGQGMCSGLRDAANLAWKLDFVLRGLAHDTLLDTYGQERAAQVADVIALSVEMGQVACITDPDIAAGRDAAFLSGHVPAAKPFPGLRPGKLAVDALAGAVSVHGELRKGTEVFWPDDLAHGRFTIVTTDAAKPSALADRAVTLGIGADHCHDMSGRYTAFLDANHLHGFIVRPDGYVFGTAHTAAELEALQTQLVAALDLPA